MAESSPPTAEQILSKLFTLRNECEEAGDEEGYEVLHAAFLFLSYQMSAFKQYLEDLRRDSK